MRNKYEILSDGCVAIHIKYKDSILTTFVYGIDLPTLLNLNIYWEARWSKSANTFYIQGRNKNGKYVQLHRLLMGIDKEDHLKCVVDHQDWNGLNNRRNNLKVVTRSINQLNRRGPTATNTSGYRGVTFDRRRKKWMAQIGFKKENGQRSSKFLGYFDDVHEAGQAALYYRQSIGARA